MVEIKNIIEDIALEILENSDEAGSGNLSRTQRKEVLAYALNRIKPMYITSNKGFTNVINRYQNDPQFLADIMVQLSEAIRVVKKTIAPDPVLESTDENTPYYTFPKIYGKIISSRTLMVLDNATVTIFIDSEPAGSFVESWKNPQKLTNRDEGIFSFGPKPIKAVAPYKAREFLIKILIENGGKSHEKVLTYTSAPVFLQNLKTEFFENVLQIEDIYVNF